MSTLTLSGSERCKQDQKRDGLQKHRFALVNVSIGLVLGTALACTIIGVLRVYSCDNRVAIYCEDQHLAGPRISNFSMSSYQNWHPELPISTYQVILRQSLPNRMNVPLIHIKPAQNEGNKSSARMVRYLSFDYSSEYTSPVIVMGLAAASMTLLLEHSSRLRRRRNRQPTTISPSTR